MQEANWETGNIYGLNDELTLLYNHFKAMNITEVEGFPYSFPAPTTCRR